jgi:hypothetical protein
MAFLVLVNCKKINDFHVQFYREGLMFSDFRRSRDNSLGFTPRFRNICLSLVKNFFAIGKEKRSPWASFLQTQENFLKVYPEYVILEDFNFTRGRLYPRYKSTPARFVPGVFVFGGGGGGTKYI